MTTVDGNNVSDLQCAVKHDFSFSFLSIDQYFFFLFSSSGQRNIFIFILFYLFFFFVFLTFFLALFDRLSSHSPSKLLGTHLTGQCLDAPQTGSVFSQFLQQMVLDSSSNAKSTANNLTVFCFYREKLGHGNELGVY